MIMKLLAVGFREYFSDRFNSFDAFIIFVSSIDVVISSSLVGSDNTSASSTITAMRIFRLLRVFKLIKAWNKLTLLVITIGKTVLSVGYFVLLLSIFIVVYTLLGMNLFAFKVAFDDENKLDLYGGEYPDSTFNNFL
jgi:hypothetical protein